MSNKAHWVLHIFSIMVIGAILAIPHNNTPTYEDDSYGDKYFMASTTVPQWELDWQTAEDDREPNTHSFLHTMDCEYFFIDPKKSYDLYVDMQSIGTREQHDEFFKTHCVGEYAD